VEHVFELGEICFAACVGRVFGEMGKGEFIEKRGHGVEVGF
jgi:hypothetical protein